MKPYRIDSYQTAAQARGWHPVHPPTAIIATDDAAAIKIFVDRRNNNEKQLRAVEITWGDYESITKSASAKA